MREKETVAPIGAEVFVVQIDVLRLATIREHSRRLSVVDWKNKEGNPRSRKVRLTTDPLEWWNDRANRFGLVRSMLSASQDSVLMSLVGTRLGGRNILGLEGVTR